MVYNHKKFEQLLKIIAFDAMAISFNLPHLRKNIIEDVCKKFGEQLIARYNFLEGE